MPQKSRPAKELGNTTYVEEVNDGKLDIIDVELDADFKVIYDLCNGVLDDDNINTNLLGKKIAYAKLNLTGQIQPPDFAPGTIITAIPPNSIGPAQLIDGVFVDSKNNLGVGVTVQDQQIAGTDNDFGFVVAGNNVEVVVVERTWTTRGGFFTIHGVVNGLVQYFTTGAPDVIINLRAGPGGTGIIPGAPAQRYFVHIGVGGISLPDISFETPFSAALLASGALATGAVRAQITAQVSDGGAQALRLTSSRLLISESA